jgi:hypothetical protein
MTKTKKCSSCGYEFTYDDNVYVSPYVQPYGEGAKYFYDLWHFNVEKCPNCGYASCDISEISNKDIVNDEQYQNILNTDILVELNTARPNRIGDYLQAGYYYASIGDNLNNAKAVLQAGDLVYAELMYWDEYILDSSNSVNALISKSQYNELKKFGDFLYNSAIDTLESYVKDNPDDIDSMILLAGSLADGNKIQNIKGAKILSQLKSMRINPRQRKALEFLMEDLG